jgi:cytosine/uracil/thiamine/allantoin permease
MARVGLLFLVATVVLVLVFEPALTWFVVPTLLAGIPVAFILRSSQASRSEKDQVRPEIQISKIPVKGSMGLVFTVGSMAIFCIALPEARWFLLLAIPVGALAALILHAWHNRHPIT